MDLWKRAPGAPGRWAPLAASGVLMFMASGCSGPPTGFTSGIVSASLPGGLAYECGYVNSQVHYVLIFPEGYERSESADETKDRSSILQRGAIRRSANKMTVRYSFRGWDHPCLIAGTEFTLSRGSIFLISLEGFTPRIEQHSMETNTPVHWNATDEATAALKSRMDQYPDIRDFFKRASK